MAKKLSPFEQAFADARKAYLAGTGDKNFTFNGKLYNTNLAGEGSKEPEDLPKTTDAKVRMSRQSGPPTTTQGATYPKEEDPKPRARSLVDQGRGVQLYKDVDTDAVLQAGLGLASLYPGTIAARAVYGAARPLIGAAAKYLSKKDSPAASVADDIKEPSFNPDKMVDRRSTTFPGRSEPKFNPDKMTGYDRPEPMKKGGAVKQYTKGGKISLDACGVSTHKPAKKNPNF